MNYGYWGVIIGITLAGLVYAVLAIIIKLAGSGWVNKLMPPVIAVSRRSDGRAFCGDDLWAVCA